MTVFDPTILLQVVDDARQRTFALDFVTTFRQLLERRVARIARAVSVFDLDEAMDAVLSLKVSASMAGARELADIAGRLAVVVGAADRASASAEVLLLPAAARRAEVAIGAYLDRTRSDAPGQSRASIR